jgi:hypothetical protein
MQFRSTQHKVCRSLADLSAITQDSDVLRLCMFVSFFDAVRQQLHTNMVAFFTVLDALFDIFVHWNDVHNRDLVGFDSKLVILYSCAIWMHDKADGKSTSLQRLARFQECGWTDKQPKG